MKDHVDTASQGFERSGRKAQSRLHKVSIDYLNPSDESIPPKSKLSKVLLDSSQSRLPARPNKAHSLQGCASQQRR